jgi:multidrug efflux pump
LFYVAVTKMFKSKQRGAVRVATPEGAQHDA